MFVSFVGQLQNESLKLMLDDLEVHILPNYTDLPMSLVSPALVGKLFTIAPPGKAVNCLRSSCKMLAKKQTSYGTILLHGNQLNDSKVLLVDSPSSFFL